jgi:hypothetical protein
VQGAEELRGELQAMRDVIARLRAAQPETQGWDLVDDEQATQSTLGWE